MLSRDAVQLLCGPAHLQRGHLAQGQPTQVGVEKVYRGQAARQDVHHAHRHQLACGPSIRARRGGEREGGGWRGGVGMQSMEGRG
jgi:hypothetical protein